MQKSVRFLVYMIIAFTFLGSILEVYRISIINIDLQERLGIIGSDVLELSLEDDFRKEGISYIADTDEAEDLFLKYLKDEFKLDDELCNIDQSIFGEFHIQKLEVFSGSYSYGAVKNEFMQDEVPYLNLRLETTIKPVILNNEDIVIPLKVFLHIVNSREDK